MIRQAGLSGVGDVRGSRMGFGASGSGLVSLASMGCWEGLFGYLMMRLVSGPEDGMEEQGHESWKSINLPTSYKGPVMLRRRHIMLAVAAAKILHLHPCLLL